MLGIVKVDEVSTLAFGIEQVLETVSISIGEPMVGDLLVMGVVANSIATVTMVFQTLTDYSGNPITITIVVNLIVAVVKDQRSDLESCTKAVADTHLTVIPKVTVVVAS